MKNQPQPSRPLSRAALVLGLSLAACVPASARASALPPYPVQMSVGFASRVGVPNDIWAVINVQSLTGFPLLGEATVVANGAVLKVEPIFTIGQWSFMVNLGPVSRPTTVYVNLAGRLDTGDETTMSIQAAATGTYMPPRQLDPPPISLDPLPARPTDVSLYRRVPRFAR